MADARRDTGNRGEQLAADHLRAHGHELIARNARTRHGEIDLISQAGGTLVFTEVKTARGGPRGARLDPVLSVGARKQAQVRKLARQWLAEARGSGWREIRFDVVAVTLDRGDGQPRIDHLEAAF